MAEIKSVEDRINELFDELVPFRGKCDTVAGEIVRATCRISYRWFNDGDCIGIGYGNETCNAAARFLMKYSSPMVSNYISDIWGKEYEDNEVNRLTELVIDDLDSRPELKSTPNDIDMFDFYDAEKDEKYLEDEDYDW